jgi:predicted dehydrogenase
LASDFRRDIASRPGDLGVAPLRVAVIGVGYWGPHLVRNFHQAPGSAVTHIYDIAPDRLEAMRRDYPHACLGADYHDALLNPNVDAICIATPAATHYEIAREALIADKHVWVEKPFSLSLHEAMDLTALAIERQRVLLVDHTYVYASAVQRMRQLIEDGELGTLLYYDSVRVNLSRHYEDVNVIADLASHDFALLDYLLPNKPVAVAAVADFRPERREAFAYVTLYFDEPFIAHSRVSWLAPAKVRQVTIAGARRMLVFDDAADEKLRLFAPEISPPQAGHPIEYRLGSMDAPALDAMEPLQVAARHFTACVASGSAPLTGAETGCRVVAMLEASQRSLQASGRPQPIHYHEND